MPRKNQKNNNCYESEYIKKLSGYVVDDLKNKYNIEFKDTFVLYDTLHYKFYDPRIPEDSRDSKAYFKLVPEDIKKGIALLATKNNDATKQNWYQTTLEQIWGGRLKPIIVSDDLDLDNIIAEDIEVILNPKWETVIEIIKNKRSKYNIINDTYIIERTKKIMEKHKLLSKDHFYIGKITDEGCNWLSTYEEFDSKIGLLEAKKELFFIQNYCLNSYSENSKKDIVTYLKYINGVLDYIERNENAIIFKKVDILDSNINYAVSQYYKSRKFSKILKTGLDKSLDDIDSLKDYIYKTVNPRYLMNVILQSFNLKRDEQFLLQYTTTINGIKTHLYLSSEFNNNGLKPVIFKFNNDYIIETNIEETSEDIEIVNKSKFDIFYLMLIGSIKPIKFNAKTIFTLDPDDMYYIRQFLQKYKTFFGKEY